MASDEAARLAALAAYGILDTAPERAFDDIVATAAQACAVPIAYLAFLDRDRSWCKAEIGLGDRTLPSDGGPWEGDVSVTPEPARTLGRDPVPAAAASTAPPPCLHRRVALRTPDGLVIGMLGVADSAPRTLDRGQVSILEQLARITMALLASRQALADRDRALAARDLAWREQDALVAERDAERLRLKAVLDSAPVGILFAEALSGRVVGQNPRADRIFGHALLPAATVAQQARWHLHGPDGQPLDPDRHPLLRALTTGETSAGEEYLYRRGGETLAWVQLTAGPIRDAAGAITGGVLCVEDIAVRKATEGALRRLNETLEATVAQRTRELDSIWRHSRDMLGVLRPDGSVLRVNPAWTDTLGWTGEDLRDTPLMDLVHPEDRVRTAEAMTVLEGGGSMPGFENRCRHRDGAYRWLSWNAVLHEGLVYAVVRDVTAERDAGAALAKAEDELRQSQKMEAVGQLTGGIAHDFNNLLTGITGALDLLQRRIAQGRTGEIGRYADIAVASAGRAAALTHRLLAFSRRQPLDPRPTDGNRLVGAMEDLLRRTIGEAIGVEVTLAEDLWPTLCDAHQLENALLNLVINARDAMPDGGRLEIGTRNVTPADERPEGVPPGSFICLTVADTGAGMAPDVAARAFDPFFTTKPPGQGTGLGLSMVYGFVRQSEGHVALDTAPGRGTTVRLFLPRFVGAETGGDTPARPPASVAAGADETVLVVEDDTAVRDLVVEVLADLGYRALQAPDGPAALAIIESAARVDLLVTDVGLPGMNGRQLAERARRLRPELPVLFTTGYAEDTAFGPNSPDAAPQVLPKPFAIDVLAARVRAMIDPAGGAPTSA